MLLITYALPSKPLIVDQQLVYGLNLADPTYGQPGCIDILLSANTFAALSCLRKESDIATIALETKLALVLYGKATSDSSQHQRNCFLITTKDNISAVQQFLKVEEVPTLNSLSPDDLKCEDFYEQTHTHELQMVVISSKFLLHSNLKF